MATVTVCDRCGQQLPEDADQANVVTTANLRFDLCEGCRNSFGLFMEGWKITRTLPEDAA